MKPPFEHTFAVSRLNNILRLELGEHPPFEWKWSEELTVGIYQGYDFVANMETGLLEPRPKYQQRKQALQADRQWLMTSKESHIPERLWLETFGWQLEYPKGGQWMPVTDAFGLLIAMPTMQMPDRKTTEDFIVGIKMRRQMSEFDYAEMLKREEVKRNSVRDERIMAAIDARTPVLSLDPKMVFPGVGDGPKSNSVN